MGNDMTKKRANGEGSIYQRPNGTWVGVVDFGWVNGHRKRKSVSGKTRMEASKKIRTLLTTRDASLPMPTTAPRVDQWFDTYLNDVAAKKVRPSTLHRYQGDVRNHVIPALGRKRLDQVSPADLTALYNAKLASGLSPVSVRHLHAVIRRALNVACKWQLITRNVAMLVDPPSMQRREIEPLSASQSRQLLDACRGDRLEARWAVGIALGLRQGEVLGLQWQDVDLDSGSLSVRRALQRQKGAGLVFTEPKTDRSRRTIPLPLPLLASMRAHRSRQLEERLVAGTEWADSNCVFATLTGKPTDPRDDWMAFKSLLVAAGLPNVRLHDLRHTAASLLLLQGVSARVVMEVLGHSQISLTLNTYSHVAPEMQVDAMDRVSSVLWH